MTNFDEIYNESMSELNQLFLKSCNEIGNCEKINFDNIEKVSSNLDGYDYCFAIGIGLVGTFVSTNNQLAEYLDEIHKSASEASGEYDFLQKFLGKLLHHKGDTIDQMEGKFINRVNEPAYGLFHRLLWGHDVLRFGEDNPFYLMFEQKGVMGIVRALRHLLADTMSCQGLPLPGTSLLDYKQDNGKLSNYLIKLSQNLSVETCGNKKFASDIYSHMSTIRFQDIMGGMVAKILTEIYCIARNIENNTRKIQFQLVTYAINFFGEAILGATRQRGVPYINIPLAGMTIKKLIQLYCTSIKETKELHKKTNQLIDQGDELALQVKETDNMIIRYDSGYSYHEELERNEKQILDLLEFFEEG